ncbi:MAG: CHAT domain-containing protein, partial [Roseiflexaceae bacterium]|nr:CHAT domain-containing protein [Roseiflexaceae bacterium]
GQRLACSAITGPRIRGKLHAEQPAFVLNACHAGRTAPLISGAASWATQLIGSGAGMLIAPLWSVTDTLATQFSRALYGALLRPEGPATLAEAVWHARTAIRQPDDPTWLA